MRLVPLVLICVGFDLIQASDGALDIVDIEYPDGKTLQVAKWRFQQKIQGLLCNQGLFLDTFLTNQLNWSWQFLSLITKNIQ